MRNVPKLRFKEFTDEWEEKKLGEITNFLDGKRKPLKDSDRNNKKGVYPYYGASGIIDYINEYIFDKELILLGEDGANILTRNTRLAFLAIGKYWVNNHAHVIEGKKNINQYFLCEYLESLDYTQYNTGTAQPKLNQEVCKNILIKFPELKEQEKIADFLSNVDKKISITEEKLNLFNEYKKGIMQKIFNQELRFKDENGNDYPEWEEKKLGDILDEYVEKTTINNQYPTLSSTATGIYLQEEYFNKQIASSNNIGYKILNKNRLVLSPQNLWLGNININFKYEIGIVSPSYKVFNINESLILIKYLNNLLKTNEMLFKYKNASEQGASVVRRNLDMNQFFEIIISIPSLEEQEKIADFLSSINIKIEKISNELESLKEFKKGLLQQMFV